MQIQARSSKSLIMSATDTTVGSALLTAVSIRGSAGAMEVTLLDGTAIKWYVKADITRGENALFTSPLAFSNLVIDVTGTGAYSVAYIPVP